MALKEGDVIRFDYTLWADGDKKPLDTSLESVAQKEGIARDGKEYKPLTITVGRRQVIPGLEKALLDLEPGKTETIDVGAEEGYGERDPKKVQDVPMAQFRKQKLQPEVGMQINMGQERGTITRVAGGRVRVDMNHALAGKALRYEVTVQKVITEPTEKIEAVLEGLFPGGAKHTMEDGALSIEVPDQAKFDQNWPMAKFRVITELRAAAGDDVDIKLIETYPAMPGDAQASSEEE